MISSRLSVIGWPIEHSLSPAMHGAALQKLAEREPEFSGWTYDRVPVAVAALPEFVRAVRADPSYRGFNVTVPHKVAILSLLDGVEGSAKDAGAVNTVVRRGEQLLGLNTDVEGFARSVEETGFRLHDKRILVLGAGGAARAVVVAAMSRGASAIHVAARDRAKADLLASLSSRVSTSTLDRAALVRFAPDLLVQATSASLDPAAALALAEAIPLDEMRSAVMDLAYRPRRTALLLRAEALGRKTIDGVGMLVHQGALALAHWTQSIDTERRIDVEAMRAAVLEALEPT